MGIWNSGIVDNDAAMDYLNALYRQNQRHDRVASRYSPTTRADVNASVNHQNVETQLRHDLDTYTGSIDDGAAETILAAIGLVAVTAAGFGLGQQGAPCMTSATDTLAEAMGARNYGEYLGLLTAEQARDLLPQAAITYHHFTRQSPIWIYRWNNPHSIRITLNALSQLLRQLTATNIPVSPAAAETMALDEPLEIRFDHSGCAFVAYLAHGIIEYQLRGQWAQPLTCRDILPGEAHSDTQLPVKPYLGWQNDVINWVRTNSPNTFTVH